MTFAKVRDPLVKRAYIYPRCALCRQPKGRSNRPLCPRCGHRVARQGYSVWQRDSAIVSLYYAGVGSPKLAQAFGITKQRVLQIVKGWA